MTERRFTLARVQSEVREVLLGEKGLFYTIIALVKRPGDSLAANLVGQDDRFTTPIKFVFLCVAMATVAINLVGVPSMDADWNVFESVRDAEDRLSPVVEELTALSENPEASRELRYRVLRALQELKTPRFVQLNKILTQWMNAALLLAVPFYAAGTWLVFPRGMNLAEHVVINSYIYGVQNVLAVLTVGIGWWNYSLYSAIYIILSLAYQVYAWQQIFDIRSIWSWLLCGVLIVVSLIAYILILALMFSVLMIFQLITGV